jgi:multicomponent Na+:H+ antiporter subunit D
MNWTEHLPALAIILPLLGAPLTLLLGQRRLAWFIGVSVCVIGLLISLDLLRQVAADGAAISYHLGGWAPPWGIEIRVDLLNAFVLLIVSAMAAWVFVYARRSVDTEIPAHKQTGFYAGLLLVYAGLAGITLTGDAFNAFVFLEISSLASYAVISMGRDRRALTAAFQYLVMGTIGATFYLIGVGFLYMMTGTLNMADLAQRLPAVSDTSTVQAGFAFLSVGIALKLAMFPLHLWLPNAYAFAPSVVSIFLAATATKVAVYLLLRMVFSVFGVDFTFAQTHLEYLLLPLAMIAAISASLVAIFQTNLKRMLAYSSVAQIGYMLMGIAIGSAAGITATLLHLFNHALMKGALFMALGAVAMKIGSVQLHRLAGLGYHMPWTAGAFVVGALSLIGIPLTAGFLSKWYLISASLDAGWWWLVVVILISSLLAVVYVWRVIEVVWFREPHPSLSGHTEAPMSVLLPTWGLALANIYFGIDSDLTVGTAKTAASVLFGAGS